MTTPSRETIAKRIKAGWEPERARTLPPNKVGNTMKTELRPYIYPKNGKFFGNVRGPGDRRTYLGTYATRQEAEDAAARYLLTGEKPPRSNARKDRKPREPREPRAPRPAQRRQPETASASPTASRRSGEDRIAMMRQIWRRLQ